MKTLSILLLAALCTACGAQTGQSLSEKELLGKAIFFDEALSHPAGQSCATCHTLEKGYADRFSRAISEGAVKGLFSNRNSMTVAYSAFVPPLHYDSLEQVWVGGLFWDGRAADLCAQATEPLLNPLEMGNPDAPTAVAKARTRPWFAELLRLYAPADHPDSLLACMADALACYQASQELCPFDSKYDAYLEGRCTLSDEELLGLELFRDKAMCAECHILDADPVAGRVLFTDHTYDNLGIPRMENHPYYRMDACYNPLGERYVDPGLGAIVGDSAEMGKFRVPTLRNIALTAPYGHNGYFATLEEIVNFYNVRDLPGAYPPAEYPATVNREELGDLGLSAEEEAALVAFMRTLSDGYRPAE